MNVHTSCTLKVTYVHGGFHHKLSHEMKVTMYDHLPGIVDMFIDTKRRRWIPHVYADGRVQVIPTFGVVHFQDPWAAQKCMVGLSGCSTHAPQH